MKIILEHTDIIVLRNLLNKVIPAYVGDEFDLIDEYDISLEDSKAYKKILQKLNIFVGDDE